MQSTTQIPAGQLKPGMVYVTHYGERAIKSAGVEREFGRDWFVWRWDRVSRVDGIDCGYGGVLLESAGDELINVTHPA